MPRARTVSCPAFICLAILGAACAPLPDVTPFSTATRQLASAVRTSGDAAVLVIADVQDQTSAEGMRSAWEARDMAMRSLVRYSDGLVSIVQGSRESQSNAAGVGDAVHELAIAGGLVTAGGSAAAGVAIDVGELVLSQIAKAKAARSLEEALEEAQPIVDAVAAQLGRRLVLGRAGNQPGNDVTDLVAIYRGAEDRIKSEREAETLPTNDFVTVLTERRASLQDQIAAGDQAALMEAVQLGDAVNAAQAELHRQQGTFDERARRVQKARALAEALASAVDAWAVAHADLVNAVKQRRAVNIESLTDATIEIRTLVKRIHEL